MRKFAGLSLALVMGISLVMSYGLAKSAKGDSLNNSASQDDAALKNLDSSLQDKIRDYLQIITDLEKLSQAKDSGKPVKLADILSGGTPPRIAPKPRLVHKAVAKAAPVKPWWSDYELTMVAYSDKSQTAVISGKFVREGDEVKDGVTVKKIESHSVILEHKDNSSAASQNSDDNLKTLFIKTGKR